MDLITKLEENINNFFSSIATLRYEEHKKDFITIIDKHKKKYHFSILSS